MTVNQQPKDVTKNLEEALQNLRIDSRPRVLRADALCIHQDNDEERTHQIQLMKDIYKSASEVLIWLGRLDDTSRIAFDFIRKHVDLQVWEYR
jgi:hypothetical protein